MSVKSGPVVAPNSFIDTKCGKSMVFVLFAYGLFNTFLFFKFTPVYQATECAVQTATMDDFEMGSEISVGLAIQVVCWNPNNYAVQIMTSEPGGVFIGEHRETSVGKLALVRGSNLPAKESGAINVRMNANLPEETSMTLLPHLMEDDEIPMFLELQFVVSVNVGFLGVRAPFKKKCGMVMAGVLTNAKSRLGPMICRDSFEELGELPHVWSSQEGDKMSFSAAQMDPERIRLGEAAKNVSIIGLGGLAYVMGFKLLYGWIMKCLERRPPSSPRELGGDRVGLLDESGRRWCTRGMSGNFEEQLKLERQKQEAAATPGLAACFRGQPTSPSSRGTLLAPKPPDSFSKKAAAFFGGRGAQETVPDWKSQQHLEEQVPQKDCILAPMMTFLNCNRSGARVTADAFAAASPTPYRS